MRHRFRVLSVIAVAGFCSAAQAAPIVLFLDPSFGSTEHTGATGALTLSFTEDMDDDWLHIEIANTTPPEVGSKLTAAVIEVPDFLGGGLTFADGGTSDYFDMLTFDADISPPWLNAVGGYDLMFTSDGNFEGGNPNGGPTPGLSQQVVVNLGDTGRTPMELESAFRSFYLDPAGHVAAGRFQSVGPDGEGSDKIAGGIPEPGTLALMSCAALAMLRRNRRRIV